MLMLILDGQTAMAGAGEGLELCLRSLIPSLFPFLFLSSILTGALWGTEGRLLRPLCRFLGIPEGAHAILIPGFLGGYPAGAQTIGQAYMNGKLDLSSAVHLLRFCSNAGPAFLFGIIAAAFPDRKTPWTLWVIHISSALMVALLDNRATAITGGLSPLDRSPAEALAGTVKTMGILCGWVICFRILLKFMDRWFLWILPEELRILIWGLLELSNGCCALSDIRSLDLRFVICSAILAFGGICVALQTASVAESLPIASYLQGKLFHTLFAILLSVLYLRYGFISIILVSSFFFLPVIIKKRGSIPEYSGV